MLLPMIRLSSRSQLKTIVAEVSEQKNAASPPLNSARNIPVNRY